MEKQKQENNAETIGSQFEAGVSMQLPDLVEYELPNGVTILTFKGKPLVEVYPGEYDWNPFTGKITYTYKYRRLSD